MANRKAQMYALAHLFVKVPYPADSEGTLCTVTTSLFQSSLRLMDKSSKMYPS